MRKAIRRGDLFYADLNPVVGSEQGGIRPVLVIQNDVGNHFSPTVVAAAITSRKAKNSLPRLGCPRRWRWPPGQSPHAQAAWSQVPIRFSLITV